MKNFYTLIIFLSLTVCSFSQIANCSECHKTAYSKKDVNHLSLLELKIFRNEIFARHQYLFKDDRLTDYFLNKYDWYKPDYKTAVTITLNDVEKKNINLLLELETIKEDLKKTTIITLQDFKLALIKNDSLKINIALTTEIENNVDPISMKRELKKVLSKIDIDGIHWHNEKGLFKITTDDGYFLNEVSIVISNNQITLRYADIGYSELFNDDTAFSFGSNFDSVNEYQSWYVFEIKNDLLILISHQAAG